MPRTARSLSAVGALALTLLGVAACGDDAEPPGGEEVVGTTLATWIQDSATAGEEIEVPTDTVLSSEQDYRDWLEDLAGPPEMAEALDVELDLETSVAVVASFRQCDNALRLVTDGSGAVDAQVYDPTRDEIFACAWSPHVVQLYVIGLDELGVDSADDVHLVENLGGAS